MDRAYIETARLMLLVAPQVFRAPDFAMKGGTALNIFLHDMPRLSVDIDVALPTTPHRATRRFRLSGGNCRHCASALKPWG
jgi:predicted nucleotidyltransferase component of viral defense system